MEDGNFHLKIVMYTQMAVGFWPGTFKNNCLDELYKLLYRVTISYFGVFVLSQFVELYMIIGTSLEEFTALMAIVLIYGIGLVKVWVLSSRRAKTLVRKIQVTETNILTGEEEETRAIFTEYAKKGHIVTKLMASLGGVCYALFVLTPFLEEATDPRPHEQVVDNVTVYLPRPLPLVSWFPFDRYKYYWYAYAVHAAAATINTTYIVGCDNMFFAFMIFVTGQIKILQRYIEKVKGEDGKEDSATVRQNLLKVVVYHHNIIKFVEELDVIMRWFLLMDFAACALQIAMIGFEIMVSDLSFTLLKNITYINSMIMQLFLFYWHGNEILLESEQVGDAVWNSRWFECDESAKRTLLQIMTRSQKPLRLSVGVFYYMSTQTMVTILRSSYTYLAVMQRFYSTKK